MIHTKFDETIQAILEDLSNQGKNGITKTGGNITPQQSSTSSVTSPSTTMPSTKMKFSNGPNAPQTGPNQQNNSQQQALVGKDGKPLVGADGKLFDINLAQSNPKAFFDTISKFHPDDQQMVQQTAMQMFGNNQ